MYATLNPGSPNSIERKQGDVKSKAVVTKLNVLRSMTRRFSTIDVIAANAGIHKTPAARILSELLKAGDIKRDTLLKLARHTAGNKYVYARA